jgi:hypothetical protein
LRQRIDFAEQVTAEARNWIARLEGQGKDTAALEAALAEYETQIDAAQSSWNTANGILATAAGFDAAGEVTDPDAARQTLQDAGDAMRQTHRLLADAGRAFRRAVQEFRRLNAAPA